MSKRVRTLNRMYGESCRKRFCRQRLRSPGETRGACRRGFRRPPPSFGVRGATRGPQQQTPPEGGVCGSTIVGWRSGCRPTLAYVGVRQLAGTCLAKPALRVQAQSIGASNDAWVGARRTDGSAVAPVARVTTTIAPASPAVTLATYLDGFAAEEHAPTWAAVKALTKMPFPVAVSLTQVFASAAKPTPSETRARIV